MMMKDNQNQQGINIEIVYAKPDEQHVISLWVNPATTVKQAIYTSGILAKFPEIDLERNSVGIFGQRTQLEHKVQAGERIEIYRNLLIDPKTRRRLLANSKA
ncbi:MAG: RnfH family protein [Gammaproteobacteria bacterium]